MKSVINISFIISFVFFISCNGDNKETIDVNKIWKQVTVNIEDFDSMLAFYHSSGFKGFLENRNEFEKRHTKDSVEIVLSRIYEFALKNASIKKNDEEWDNLHQEIGKNVGPDSSRIADHVEMSDQFDAGNFEAYSKIASGYVDKYCMDNEGQLNWTAWQFYDHVTDTALLEKALTWSKKATDLSMSYSNLDTYGHLLFKLGRVDEARTTLEKGIEIATKNKEEHSSSDELVNKLKK